MRNTQRDLFAIPAPVAAKLPPVDFSKAPMRGLTLWRPWPWSMHGWLSWSTVPGPGTQYWPGLKAIENRGWHPPADLVGKCWIAIHAGKTLQDDADSWLRERGHVYNGPMPSWVLSGRVPLLHPIPCKGSMGLWRLPPDVEARVRAEYFYSVAALDDQLEPGPRMTP